MAHRAVLQCESTRLGSPAAHGPGRAEGEQASPSACAVTPTNPTKTHGKVFSQLWIPLQFDGIRREMCS